MANDEISVSASSTAGAFELRSSDAITAGTNVNARVEHVPSKWAGGTLELREGDGLDGSWPWLNDTLPVVRWQRHVNRVVTGAQRCAPGVPIKPWCGFGVGWDGWCCVCRTGRALAFWPSGPNSNYSLGTICSCTNGTGSFFACEAQQELETMSGVTGRAVLIEFTVFVHRRGLGMSSIGGLLRN